MHLERTVLLAVGVSYAFTTATGQRAAVIVHVSGERHLVVYDPDDHERVLYTLVLNDGESRTAAELLGLPLVSDRVTDLVPPRLKGMNAVCIPIPAGSPYAGRRLGDTNARSRTGASIVAVLRDGRTIASLTPEFTLHHGDDVVVVGDDSSINGVRELLVTG
jgi:TrkA domain protein